MARGTLRCGLILIFGLSSIASAALDLVSRVGTRRSARPHAHTARTPTHPPARRIPGAGGDARTKRWTVVEWTSQHPFLFLPSPLTMHFIRTSLQTKL